MKKLLAASMTAALLASPAMAHDDDDDHKREIKQSYDFDGFDKISVVGVYKLDVQAGDEFSVRTEARKKDAEWMKVSLDGDTLILGTEEEDNDIKWKRNRKGVKAIVTMPRLSHLEVAGIATGKVSAFTGGDVEVEIAGISDLSLMGECDELQIELAGMGDLDARDLQCTDVEAQLGGMGELDVYASKRVDAEVAGMGSIEVYGNPDDVTTDKTMFSSIKIR